MKLKEITLENRPRERTQSQGAESLSEAELLAIILQKGTRNINVLELANQLISKHGLENLSQCSLQELKQSSGIGDAKACQIRAIFELHKRISSSNNSVE